MRAPQQLVLGFMIYAIAGTLLLSTPAARKTEPALVDNAFTAVSAISTTGLTTVSVADSYSWLGQAIILIMFQIGGLGYMTLSSVLILARGGRLSPERLGVLSAGFAVPRYFVIPHFVVQLLIYTAVCELLGALALWWRFSSLEVPDALWQAIFHSVSAFATAGFSLNNNSLESFAHDPVINLTIGALSYLGAIGFIVAQDVWYSLRLRERMLTLTSKVILTMTLGIFLVGTTLIFIFEPVVQSLPVGPRLLASAFQTMTASTTAGFNTIPIGNMSTTALLAIIGCMLVGASPSGTGGGVKNTTVTALLGNLIGVLRGKDHAVWFGYEIPSGRVQYAFAAIALYLIGLGIGIFLLSITEMQEIVPLVFEAASAMGTVGLSMGITGELSNLGKLIVIVLMFAGRCGPLTIGLAMLKPTTSRKSEPRADDLAV